MPGNRMSKTEVINSIAEKSGVHKKEVNAVIDALQQVVAEQLGPSGPGEVVIPGMLRLNVAIKPATPEHEGINPFTKQPAVFKAKPERRVIKARVLKGLKDSL